MQVHQRFFRELKSNSFWQSENLQILIFFSFFKEHFRLFSCHHNLMSEFLNVTSLEIIMPTTCFCLELLLVSKMFNKRFGSVDLQHDYT